MEHWPSNLPQSPTLDYNNNLRCGLVDEKEKRNPIRLRTYPEYNATFNLVMSNTQKNNFRNWYYDTIKEVAPFTVPWLEGLGFEFHFLRTVKPPKWKLMGVNYWMVTLSVEIIAGVETNDIGDVAIYVPTT